MRRPALGAFLRSRRERADPDDLGLPRRARRTPGVRRAEVAELAHISEIHYANIEQARGSKPSPDVIAAIARALRLDAGETAHLFDLAEIASPRHVGPDLELSERTAAFIETLSPVPVLVCSARLDVIGQNSAATALLEDFGAAPADQRNLARRHFLPDDDDEVWGAPGLSALSRFAAARLRDAQARYPDDRQTIDLVEELRAGSPRFDAIWRDGPVGFLQDPSPEATRVDLDQTALTCEVSVIPERDQYLVFLPPAAPGPA